MESADVVACPVENQFTKLEEGTVELLIKMGWMPKVLQANSFWFAYKRGTDVNFSTIRWSSRVGTAGMRASSCHDAYRVKPVKWEKTEVHHIWTKFYWDGKLAGEDKFNKGPTVVCQTFCINNIELEKASSFVPKYLVAEVCLSAHQKKPDKLILDLKNYFPFIRYSLTRAYFFVSLRPLDRNT